MTDRRVGFGRGREVGEPFSPTERALLDVLCHGDDPSRALAREQLELARWGGYEFEACDCFRIVVPPLPAASRIDHDGGPFSVAEVLQGEECPGLVELWVVDGYLHSVNYMPFGDDHDVMPNPQDHELVLLG